MQVFNAIDLNTVREDAALDNGWRIEISAQKASLTLAEARDLGKILRALADDPAAMHRSPKEDPTFCEEKL
jgi:hypothetical protein